MIIVWIAAYVFIALVLMGIAKRTDTPFGWLAWIPIANVFLMLMIAQRPWWWAICLLIPLVNIVVSIVIVIEIIEQRGRPPWWIFLLCIPFVNIYFLAILAWGERREPLAG